MTKTPSAARGLKMMLESAQQTFTRRTAQMRRDILRREAALFTKGRGALTMPSLKEFRAWLLSRAIPGKGIWQCRYCGILVSMRELSVDHFKPLSAGGSSGFENLVPCCRDCNAAKGDLHGASWGAMLAAQPRFVHGDWSKLMRRLKAREQHGWRKAK